MVRASVVALALALAVPACSEAGPPDLGPYPQRVRFEGADGEAVLHVAVARTDRGRQRGLMGVSSLPQDAGMAFVWTEPTESGFWMKDTLVPLSIAFVDHRSRVVSILEMRPCRSDPCPVYRSEGPYVLAVEANAGWFERHAVGPGDLAWLEAPL